MPSLPPPTDAPTHGLLALLSAERRKEIIQEATHAALQTVMTGAQTLGHLVDSLTGHDHWSALRDVPVSSLLQSSGAAPAQPAPKASPEPAAAAAKAAPVVANKVAPKAVKAAAAKPPGRPAKPAQADALDDLVTFVAAHPGLRSEQISQQLGGNNEALKARLAALVESGRLKRSGKARGTSYTAA